MRNFKKMFPGPKLKTLAARAANAYNHFLHKKALDALEKENHAVVTWLLEEPKEHWCRYLFDTTTKAPDNCTNFVESFNNVINWYRDRPVFALCEYIREKWTQWIVQRREIAETWKDKVVPSVKAELEKLEKDSWGLIVGFCGDSL